MKVPKIFVIVREVTKTESEREQSRYRHRVTIEATSPERVGFSSTLWLADPWPVGSRFSIENVHVNQRRSEYKGEVNYFTTIDLTPESGIYQEPSRGVQQREKGV
jgi:hypothetical protein